MKKTLKKELKAFDIAEWLRVWRCVPKALLGWYASPDLIDLDV
jgi:hypothetical protein